VVEAYLLAANVRTSEWGPIYNVGTGVQTTLRDAVEAAKQVLNIVAEPVWNTTPNRSWDANVWVSDNRKIRAQLGWQPRSTFAEGFRLMVDWFRQGPPPCYAGQPPAKAGS
jgi:nucleoside-diphosphate-sugar epimerase